MKNTLLNLGKSLSKEQQRQIIGRGGSCGNNPCDAYNGPIIVNCDQYEALPDHHKKCVMVGPECFPR